MALISHASKVMLKILQSRLQKYVNCELPDVPGEFRKGRGARDQIVNIRLIIEKASEVKSLSHVRLSPSMGFSRQEYWNGLPFPSPGDLPKPDSEPGSPVM